MDRMRKALVAGVAMVSSLYVGITQAEAPMPLDCTFSVNMYAMQEYSLPYVSSAESAGPGSTVVLYALNPRVAAGISPTHFELALRKLADYVPEGFSVRSRANRETMAFPGEVIFSSLEQRCVGETGFDQTPFDEFVRKAVLYARAYSEGTFVARQ